MLILRRSSSSRKTGCNKIDYSRQVSIGIFVYTQLLLSSLLINGYFLFIFSSRAINAVFICWLLTYTERCSRFLIWRSFTRTKLYKGHLPIYIYILYTETRTLIIMTLISFVCVSRGEYNAEIKNRNQFATEKLQGQREK